MTRRPVGRRTVLAALLSVPLVGFAKPDKPPGKPVKPTPTPTPSPTPTPTPSPTSTTPPPLAPIVVPGWTEQDPLDEPQVLADGIHIAAGDDRDLAAALATVPADVDRAAVLIAGS